MLRGLVTALIAVLVLYAPIELLRLILWYDLEWYFVFELTFIWLLFITAVAIIYKLVRVR